MPMPRQTNGVLDRRGLRHQGLTNYIRLYRLRGKTLTGTSRRLGSEGGYVLRGLIPPFEPEILPVPGPLAVGGHRSS